MKILLTIALAFCCASPALAGDAPAGAKAIFVDSTSGAVIESRSPASKKSTPKTAARTKSSRAVPTATTEVSGLMYYVELVAANGEARRVTADRVFRTGERILLHVVSSIDGTIAVYQRTPDGRAVKLFPDDKIDASNARVAKGVDTILPSPTAWFRFDSQAGTEELTIVLTPHVSRESQAPLLASLATATRYDDIALTAGSKGLVLETESAGPAQATYVVRRTESGRPPESIIVPIRLEHR